MDQIGKPIQLDEATRFRSKLMFPRVLIEVRLHQDFPQSITFIYEFGIEVMVDVQYEWIPLICKSCNGMGHKTEDCRHKEKVKQVWVPKVKKQPVVDEKGFQEVIKGKKNSPTCGCSIAY